MHVGFGWCLEQCVVLLNRRLKIPTENWAQSNKNGNFHSEHSLCTHFKLQQQPNIVLGSKLVGSYLVNFWLMQVSNLHVVWNQSFSSELGHGTTLSSTWIKIEGVKWPFKTNMTCSIQNVVLLAISFSKAKEKKPCAVQMWGWYCFLWAKFTH